VSTSLGFSILNAGHHAHVSMIDQTASSDSHLIGNRTLVQTDAMLDKSSFALIRYLLYNNS